MNWWLSNRADPRAVVLADRHYNRQKPGSPQFVPPGACLVLLAHEAVWVTSWPLAQYVKHKWAGAWMNSIFRRESGPKPSFLIREAVAATRWRWPNVPDLGMVTFIDKTKVRPRRDGYGKCYLKAGFEQEDELTKGGLLVFRLKPENMPKPEAPNISELFTRE